MAARCGLGRCDGGSSECWLDPVQYLAQSNLPILLGACHISTIPFGTELCMMDRHHWGVTCLLGSNSEHSKVLCACCANVHQASSSLDRFPASLPGALCQGIYPATNHGTKHPSHQPKACAASPGVSRHPRGLGDTEECRSMELD